MNPETAAVIENVEQFAKRRFRYREEIGIILDAAGGRALEARFEELAFVGKFIKNARSILTSDNPNNPATDRLADELSVNLEKSIRIIALLIENNTPEEKNLIARRFLNLNKENFENLLALMEELSWFKNYSLDKQKPAL